MCVCDCALAKRSAYLIFMGFVIFFMGLGIVLFCFLFSPFLCTLFSFAWFQEQYFGDMQCIIHAFLVGECDALGMLPMRFYAQCDR